MATKKLNVLNDHKPEDYQPQLSKVRIGEKDYFLKDAEGRLIAQEALAEETLRATAAEEDLDGRLDTAEGKITTLEGEVETIEGKPAYNITSTQISNWDNEVGTKAALAQEVTRATGAEEALDGRLDVIEGTGEGSIKKAVADEATARDNAIASAINALDVTDAAEDGKYVSAVSETDGKITVTRATLPTAPEYTIVKQDTPESGMASTYYLTKDNVQVGAKINIAKDQFLKEAHFYAKAEDVPAGVTPPSGQEFPALRLVFEVAEGKNDIWIAVKELVDTYTAGAAIDITNNKISVKVKANDSYIEIDSNDQIATKGIDAAISTAVAAEATLRETADNALDGRLDIIEGADTVDGSIKKALKDAKAYTDAETARAEGVEATLVPQDRTIAGVDLEDDITQGELQTALGLENLAYSDTASGKITVATSQTISGVKATGNLSGSASLTIGSTSTAATLTKGDYTPAGSITGEAISGGSINVTVKDATAGTAVTDITYTSYTPAGTISPASADGSFTALKEATFQAADDGIAIAGTVSAPAINVTAGTQKTFVTSITAGSQASINTDKFNGGAPATLTYAASDAFVKEGVKVEVGTGTDSETLIFSEVTNKGTASVISAFNGGSAASISEGFFTPNTLQTVDGTDNVHDTPSAALADAPVFTGNKYKVNTTSDTALKNVVFSGTSEDVKFAGAKYLKQEIDAKTFTPVAATLGFSGTTATNVLVTGVNYDKANASQSGSVTINNASLNVGAINVAAEEVTVQVRPDASV